MTTIQAINPFTGKLIREIDETPISQLSVMVENARKACPEWSSFSLEKRSTIIKQLIPLMQEHKQALADAIHTEVGKPMEKAQGEVDDAISEIEYFLNNTPKALEEKVVYENAEEKSNVRYDPIGVVVGITPWNFPLEQPVLAFIPAVLTGNTVLIKPSEHSTLVVLELFTLIKKLEENGLPKNTIQLVVGGKEIGKALVQQDIDLVYLTGSLRAGKQVMRDSADKLHKVILELGGKDPAIVLSDCNIDKTAQGIVEGATDNTGQVCCAIERVYVDKKIIEPLTQKIVEKAQQVTIDTGNSPHADIGPLVREFQLETVQSHVEDARAKGAHILTGGKRLEGKGYFFPPTVITQLSPEMAILKKETFGPIIPLVPFDTVEEAIEKANDTNYGLTASVWTHDSQKAADIGKKLVAGTVTVNTSGGYRMGSPWGGAKQSGIGRVNTVEGIREFCNIKHVLTKK